MATSFISTPDYLRRVLWCCIFCWLSAALGVVLAILRADWVVACYALTSAVASSGWLIATRRWRLWRDIAAGLMAAAQRDAE